MADALLTRDYVFICVDIFVDGKRAGGHGTYMRVAADMACKDILNLFLQGIPWSLNITTIPSVYPLGLSLTCAPNGLAHPEPRVLLMNT